MTDKKIIQLFRKSTAGVFCVLCLCSYLAASGKNSGVSSAQFLKLGGSARASSMGEAYAGISDDAAAVFYNPAGLANIEETMLSLTHNFMFEDLFCDWISFIHSTGYGEFGVGIQYLSYGTIKEISETGVEGGTMNPYDMAVTLSHGREILGFSAGMNLKIILSKISNNASAVCADFGGMYKIMNDDVSLGAVIQNVGTSMKYSDKSAPLPLNFKLGGQYNVDFNWIVSLDLNMPLDGLINAGAGAEYNCEIGDNVNLLGRLGYTTRTSQVEGVSGINAGFGVVSGGYQIDYAFVPLGDLGLSHKIGIGMKFD